jgi:hypothetical protein
VLLLTPSKVPSEMHAKKLFTNWKIRYPKKATTCPSECIAPASLEEESSETCLEYI